MKKKSLREISWYEIEMNVKLLAQKIKQEVDLKNVAAIVGEERGGLIPAVMLSHYLNIPYGSELFYTKDKIIIVDDIVDTGTTFKGASDEATWPELIICSLYLREHTCSQEVKDRLIFAEKIENDDWLKFPWEIGENK